MLVEPVTPPVVGSADPVLAPQVAASSARAARAWLELGVARASRPGAVDPAAGMIDALTNATEAIHEAIAACGELHELRVELHLALDEATDGIDALRARGGGAREVAVRSMHVAGGVLDRAIAALIEYAASTDTIDQPAR